ncbi:MAG: BatD family protein, partial [Candidatus Sumerlaeota bacterium]|nr:BatD family protein [Candidatus Sumerlaeota bacterium]
MGYRKAVVRPGLLRRYGRIGGGAIFVLQLLIPFFLSGSLSADTPPPIVISATVDRGEIFIGDQIDYRVTVEWDPKAIQFERIEPNPKLGVFEIVDYKLIDDRPLSPTRRIKTWKLILSTFETGDFEIPPFAVKYRNAEGQDVEGQTQPIQIRVKSALDTAATSRDVKPLKAPASIAPNPKYQRRLVAFAAAAIVLLALVAAWLVWRRRRSARGEEVWIPPKPIEELAFDDLDALEREGLAARGEVKAYYSRLSEILRIYLGRRFAILAIDMTSVELLDALARRDEIQPAYSALSLFCDEADMAKFAKWRANEERCRQSMDAVRFIIRET